LLLERLSRLEDADYNVINETIDEFYEHRTADDPPPHLVGDVREAIDHAFSPRNPVTILERLENITRDDGKAVSAAVLAWARDTTKAIRARSPTSVWVTREAIFQAREKMLKDAFETEMRLAEAYCVSSPSKFFPFHWHPVPHPFQLLPKSIPSIVPPRARRIPGLLNSTFFHAPLLEKIFEHG
jgi:hypothetical protein